MKKNETFKDILADTIMPLLFIILPASTLLYLYNKDQKELAEKFKQTLIRGEEHDLERLVTDRPEDIRKSIEKFELLLQEIEIEHKALREERRRYTKVNDTKSGSEYIITNEWEELLSDFRKLFSEYHKHIEFYLKQLDARFSEYDYGHSWYFDHTRTDEKAIEAYQKLFHLTGNKIKHGVYRMRVPEHGAKFMLKKPILTPTNAYTQNLDYYFDNILETINTYKDLSIFDTETNKKNDCATMKLMILQSLQSFLESVDNSQNIFDAKTLEKLNTDIKKLLPYVKEECELAQEHNDKLKQLNDLKSAETRLQRDIAKKKENIAILKGKDAKKLLKEHKKNQDAER